LTPRAFAPQAAQAARLKKSAPIEPASPIEPGAMRAAREGSMAESVYKVIELVGTSTESWEKAAAAAIERAAKSLRDLRVAEVVEQDLVIDKGKVEAYRTKLKVSFKYEGAD
jgi:flavin-binding protein dodecin